MKPSFTLHSTVFYKDGRESRWIQKTGLSPELQLELFNRCIVGYDPYHPDAGNPEGHAFKTPDSAKIIKTEGA